MSVQLCSGIPWHFLPICLGITSIIGILSTYFIAKKNCHIEKWLLPYVSYTGTEHPESSIFGLILNTEGFLGILIVILAWRLIRHLNLKNETLNKITLITGFLGCFGVVIVANFQVSKNKVPHYIGAFLALCIGTIYCSLSSFLTFKIRKITPGFSRVVCVVRFVTAALMVLCIVSLVILYLMRSATKMSYEEKYGIGTWSPLLAFKFANGSCVPIKESIPIIKQYLDLAMSISEWMLTVCLLFSLSLYAYEFKYFDRVKIVLKRGSSPLTRSSLDKRADHVTSIQHMPLMKRCHSSSNDVTRQEHCDLTNISTGDSDNDTVCDGCGLSKFKNNNTELKSPPIYDCTDSKTVSKSLPDISRYMCDRR